MSDRVQRSGGLARFNLSEQFQGGRVSRGMDGEIVRGGTPQELHAGQGGDAGAGL